MRMIGGTLKSNVVVDWSSNERNKMSSGYMNLCDRIMYKTNYVSSVFELIYIMHFNRIAYDQHPFEC